MRQDSIASQNPQQNEQPFSFNATLIPNTESNQWSNNVNVETAEASSDIDKKALVLESLLQELSFWESSSKPSGMRKSHSVNDVSNNEYGTRERQVLKGSTSCGGSSNIFNSTMHPDFLSERDSHCHYATGSRTTGDNPHNAVSEAKDVMPVQAEVPKSPTLAELQDRCHWNKAIDPATGRTYYYDIRTRQTQWEKVTKLLTSLLLYAEFGFSFSFPDIFLTCFFHVVSHVKFEPLKRELKKTNVFWMKRFSGKWNVMYWRA
jgi:WW domain